MKVFKLVEFTINGKSGVIVGDFNAQTSTYSFVFENNELPVCAQLDKVYQRLSAAILQLLEISNRDFLTIQRIDDFAAPIFNTMLRESKHKHFLEALKLNTIEGKPYVKKVG